MIDSFWEFILYTVLMYGTGLLLGYIWWAPLTPFKQGLMDGFMFKPLIKLLRDRKSK